MSAERDDGAHAVRTRIAAATQADHHALHVHPWLRRLSAPDLTLREYSVLLQAYCAFFSRIEQARQALCVFETLSLDRTLAALRADLRCLAVPLEPVSVGDPATPDHPRAVLAALYVLHGAQFGGQVLRGKVAGVLPGAPRHFFGGAQDRRLWATLLTELERHGRDDAGCQALCRAAAQTFRDFGQFVTEHCIAEFSASPMFGQLPPMTFSKTPPVIGEEAGSGR
ncbi:hypothetical protein FIU97_15560 [Roseivivax sp. THAF40]|uniref:biliverdin-producing heme oxygenase n=1 Tax=Roseivivax sp. THAF40 TaxID=2587858 RepID=UPI001268A649|nr:biliverdin-producing heme oxygenase [Roseivivax sp. THAF40]QFT47998.1 hypothetical protein FIU97_15560 [Roseivivax sp. THAF40]